jgi:hypothetical protein
MIDFMVVNNHATILRTWQPRATARLSLATTTVAGAHSISLGGLGDETLRLFPRQLAPAFYDRIIAAREHAGFQPRVQASQTLPSCGQRLCGVRGHTAAGNWSKVWRDAGWTRPAASQDPQT